MITSPPVAPWRSFLVEVARVRRLSPSFVRVTLTAPDLDAFADNGFDQRFKVILPLPGVGLRHDFTTRAGRQLGVVAHRTGRRDLLVYDREDPDACQEVVQLSDEEADALAELLGAARLVEHLAALTQRIEGLAIDWLPIRTGSPYAGRAIADTQARSRTGVSIVAILRGDGAIPAPAPDAVLVASTIQAGSGSLLENLAMKNEPTTNPTEVRPSCRPYWNSVACRVLRVNGRSRTFHTPNEKNMKAPTTKSDRMIGVPNRTVIPDFRLLTMTATLASSSGVGIA